MNFFKCSESILKVFQHLGLTPFNKHCYKEYNLRPAKRIFITTPIVLQTALSLILCAFLGAQLTESGYSYHYSITEICITSCFMLAQILRVISTLICCCFYEYLLCDIIYIFRRIEAYFYIHLKRKVCYKHLRKSYLKNVSMILFAYLHFFCVNIIMMLIKNRFPVINIVIRVIQCISIPSLLHAIFFLNALDYHLNELIVIIDHDSGYFISKYAIDANNRMVPRIRNRLNDYKNIYWHLWDASQQINSYFGWYLVIQFVEFFIQFLYATYWCIDYIRDDKNRAYFIRKIH